MATVTVISCAYGKYSKFIPRWIRALDELDRPPDAAYVVTDAEVDSRWHYPQAFYFDYAWRQCDTDWAWVLGIDDIALPTALDGIDDVDADVWLTGYEKSSGQRYVPKVIPNQMYAASLKNSYTDASLIRRSALEQAGGFRDIAFFSWDLWRRLAHSGARFESSGRPNFQYVDHELQLHRNRSNRSRRRLVAEMV